MKRTLNSLEAEKNLHGMVVIILCLIPFTLLIATIFVFPVLGVIQLLYAFIIQRRYNDSIRKRYVITASAWLLLIILIFLLGDIRLLRLSTNELVLLALIFLIVPVGLSIWMWQIALRDYRFFKANGDTTEHDAATYDDILDN